MSINLEQLCVRPANKLEEPRYRELMQRYHYLGDSAKIGHTLWYVATYDEEWAALLSFPLLPGSAVCVTAGTDGTSVTNMIA